MIIQILIIIALSYSLHKLATYQDETRQQKHDKYLLEFKKLKNKKNEL